MEQKPCKAWVDLIICLFGYIIKCCSQHVRLFSICLYFLFNPIHIPDYMYFVYWYGIFMLSFYFFGFKCSMMYHRHLTRWYQVIPTLWKSSIFALVTIKDSSYLVRWVLWLGGLILMFLITHLTLIFKCTILTLPLVTSAGWGCSAKGGGGVGLAPM